MQFQEGTADRDAPRPAAWMTDQASVALVMSCMPFG